jgi:hypothetical protein
MAVQVYLDGSGKLHEGRLTLAAFAAPDEIWARIENDWRAVLDAHPLTPRYIHMKELCPLKGEFSADKGWTQEASFSLLNQMLLLFQLLDK